MFKKVHLAITGKSVQWYNNNALLCHRLIQCLMVMTKTLLLVFIIDLTICSIDFMVMFVVKGFLLYFFSLLRIFFPTCGFKFGSIYILRIGFYKTSIRGINCFILYCLTYLYPMPHLEGPSAGLAVVSSGCQLHWRVLATFAGYVLGIFVLG